MNYEEVKKLLTSQGKFYINLGLERIQALLNLLDNPQERIKIIHVAGTNGKGSVCSVLANILKCSGIKTGLYTSPHLVEYTERIKINNEEISQDDFAFYVEKICTLSEENKIDLTEFEILTASAFKYFADKDVEFAVIETGLGGRFDATNVCKNPILSIITSISLDHTDRLGNTIEKIAFEKAGIIKENSRVITSFSNNGFKVIKKISEEKNSKLICASECEIPECPLIGLYQKENLSLVLEAVKLLNIDEQVIKEGFKTAHWGARLEYLKDKKILIDGAHNTSAATELKKSLDYYFKNEKKVFLYSTINTKNYKEITKILFDENDEIYFYEFNHPLAVKFEEFINNTQELKNVKQLKRQELKAFLQKSELKIITGSLYMIGELYNEIKK